MIRGGSVPVSVEYYFVRTGTLSQLPVPKVVQFTRYRVILALLRFSTILDSPFEHCGCFSLVAAVAGARHPPLL
jgi:hypothetical protein